MRLVPSVALPERRPISGLIALLLVAVLASCDDETATGPRENQPASVTVNDSAGPIFRT